MKNYLIIIACILVIIGLFCMTYLALLWRQSSWGLPNITLVYIGFGILVIGALLGAYWTYINIFKG